MKAPYLRHPRRRSYHVTRGARERAHAFGRTRLCSPPRRSAGGCRQATPVLSLWALANISHGSLLKTKFLSVWTTMRFALKRRKQQY